MVFLLSVILEKVVGVTLVNKLQAILLAEADFNFDNALYFGKITLELATKQKLVPINKF